MSKFTLGQRQFPTLGLRSQQPKNYFAQRCHAIWDLPTYLLNLHVSLPVRPFVRMYIIPYARPSYLIT